MTSNHESQLEPLLVEFFRAEMPAELRSPEFDVPDAKAVSETVTVDDAHVAHLPADAGSPVVVGSRPTGPSGLAVVVVVAACLLAVVFTIPGGPATPVRDSDGVAASSDADTGDAAPAALEPAFTLETDDVFVERVDGRVETFGAERIETSRGPVELRTVRETSNVSVFNPETGNGVDVTSEVLDIEIVPIDDPEEPVGDEFPDPRDDAPLPPEFGSP